MGDLTNTLTTPFLNSLAFMSCLAFKAAAPEDTVIIIPMMMMMMIIKLHGTKNKILRQRFKT